MGFFVLIILAPACLKGLLLEVLRKTCDKVGMAGRYPLSLESLGHLRDQVQQREARVDEAFGSCRSSRQGWRRHSPAGRAAVESLALPHTDHVQTLAVFDQHPLKRLFIGELHDPDGYLFERGKLCGPEAPCSSDDLVTVAVGPHGDGLNHPLRPQTVGQLSKLDSSKVRRGLVVDSWMLASAMV